VHQGKLRIRTLGRQRFEFAGEDGTTMTHAPPTHGTADLLRSRRTSSRSWSVVRPAVIRCGWRR
jgi:hypothetical protein